MLNKTLIVFSIFLLGHFVSFAHSKTEIGFRIVEEENQTFLEVHLTTLTLFDLLYELYPFLASEEVLNLNDYVTDYEMYFNQYINVTLNDEQQRLEFVDSNLISHDATIKFLIPEMNESVRNYEIVIGGFQFYRHPSYTVLLTTPLITQSHFLTRADNRCAGITTELTTNTNAPSSIVDWKWLTLVVVALSMLVWFIRKAYVGSFGWLLNH